MSAGVRYAGSQNYELTIRNLFTNSSEGVSGAEAVVSILDGALEIDSVTLSGTVRSGFCRSFARESSYHNVVRHALRPMYISSPFALCVVVVAHIDLQVINAPILAQPQSLGLQAKNWGTSFTRQ